MRALLPRVAAALRSDIHHSLEKFKTLFASV